MDSENRLKKVERELKMWRVGVAGIALLAIVSAAAPKRTPKTIKAEKLVLSDEQGRDRIILDTIWPQGDAYISFMDVRGKERLSVGVMDHGLPYVTLRDSGGRSRLTMDLGDTDQSAEIDISDPTGKNVVRIPP